MSLRLIRTFVLAIALPSLAAAARAAPPEAPPANEQKLLLERLTPGMRQADVDRLVQRLRPEAESGAWQAAVGRRTVSRYTLSGGDYLLVEYRDVADPNGNLGPDDKVAKVDIVDIADLKGLVPVGLFDAVRLIHLSPSVTGQRFDPTSLVRAVNRLQRLGKARALEALRVYSALAQDLDRAFRYDLDEQRDFLVARLLFVRRDGFVEMPWMYIGGTRPDVRTGDQAWPLFPLVVQDDLPFCLSPGYSLAGLAEPPSAHLDYCEKSCEVRKVPLRPSTSPIKAVQAIRSSGAWHRLFAVDDSEANTEYLLRLQAVRALVQVTGRPADEREFCPTCVSKGDANRNWARFVADPRLSNAHWDEARQEFIAGAKHP